MNLALGLLFTVPVRDPEDRFRPRSYLLKGHGSGGTTGTEDREPGSYRESDLFRKDPPDPRDALRLTSISEPQAGTPFGPRRR